MGHASQYGNHDRCPYLSYGAMMRWIVTVKFEGDGEVHSSTQVLTEREVKKIQLMGQGILPPLHSLASKAYYEILNWMAEAI